MSLLTSLFRLIPPTFRAGYCPGTLQQFGNDLIDGTQVTFLIQQGSFLYNMGSVTPAPENRIFPWLYTPNGRWYTFQYGLWVAPMDPSSREPTFRKMWKPPNGTAPTAVWSLDEGDGNDPAGTPPVSLISGAAWEIDHDFDGRYPIGVGTLAAPTLTASVALGDAGGDAQHILTEAEGAVGAHVHLLGITDPSAAAAAFAKAPSASTVPGYTGQYIAGSGGTYPYTTADLTTLPSGAGAAGVTSSPFSILPRYKAIYWIMPTIKRFYTLPA